MNFRNRCISILILLVVLVAVLFTGTTLMNRDESVPVFKHTNKETIKLWYTDEALTDYLLSKTVAYNESHDSRVEVELVSGMNYLESINKATVNDEANAPDIFIVTNDLLEKAYLAGLATEIENTDYLKNNELFSDTARNAVTYKDKFVGYPFTFETSALLYNKTYLESIASEFEVSDATKLVPASIVDILTFADDYSAPENVEFFFKWDVTDIFYNYFFIGNYITVGGESGDDESAVNIYNSESIAALKVYQEMNQFFSIDAEDTNYESIMQEFTDGKIIYTVATSDCLSRLDNSEFAFEYGIAALPDINTELKTKGMSVTNAFAINGYSLHKDLANDFIRFIYDNDKQCELYELSKKLPAWKQDSFGNNNVAQYYSNYMDTTPIPKLVETSNFWIELEACLAKVWGGADANAEAKAISEQIKSQISGEAYTESVLPDPEVELLEAEEYAEEDIEE